MKATLHLLAMPILRLMKNWIRIPYLGNRGENIIKSCTSKIQRFLTKPVKFIVTYDTKRISFFVSSKDKLPPLSCSNLVYEVSCPGCVSNLVPLCKFQTRIIEYGINAMDYSAIRMQLSFFHANAQS